LTLPDIISDLRIDLSDQDASLFSDPTLERCIKKAVYRLSCDLGTIYTVENNEILPVPDDTTREILLILGQIYACQIMISATANAFSFTSGDKKVDKTKQPEHWTDLKNDLMKEYKKMLYALNPDIEINDDDYIITPQNLNIIIYKQGSRHDRKSGCS